MSEIRINNGVYSLDIYSGSETIYFEMAKKGKGQWLIGPLTGDSPQFKGAD